MSGANDPRAWAEGAEEDFLLAKSALHRRKPLVVGACFHAQQCAEKYLKALLVSRGADFPKTHDMLMLNDLCSAAGIFLEVDARHLNNLTDYAVRTRYPGNEPALDDAKEALEIAGSIRKFARVFLGAG